MNRSCCGSDIIGAYLGSTRVDTCHEDIHLEMDYVHEHEHLGTSDLSTGMALPASTVISASLQPIMEHISPLNMLRCAWSRASEGCEAGHGGRERPRHAQRRAPEGAPLGSTRFHNACYHVNAWLSKGFVRANLDISFSPSVPSLSPCRGKGGSYFFGASNTKCVLRN